MAENRFIERPALIATIRAGLRPGSVTTVMGTAGLGKSRAIAVALEGLGPRWVVREPEALAMRVGTQIVIDGVDVEPGRLREAIARYRSDRAAVVVAARDIVGVEGESVIAIPPLSRDQACQLFDRRVHEAGGAAVDEAVLEALVDAAGCMPLAVELAAGGAVAGSAEAVRDTLGGRLDALAASGARMVRQTRIRVVVDWAIEQLSDAELGALERFARLESTPACASSDRLFALGLVCPDPYLPGNRRVQTLVRERLEEARLRGLRRTSGDARCDQGPAGGLAGGLRAMRAG